MLDRPRGQKAMTEAAAAMAVPAPASAPAAQRAAAPSAPRPDTGVEPDPRVKRPQQRRRGMLFWSGLACIALPTLLAALYYSLIAADQYAVEVRFAVRSNAGAGSSGDLLGVFTGGNVPGSTVTDSYIVIDYINSRELVKSLEDKIGLKAIYASPQADWFARFDASQPMEEFVEYWRRRIHVAFDNTSQIVTVEVRAFTAEDARAVAAAVLEESEALINQLSARARDDAVKSAQGDVARMEELLKKHRAALSKFRDTKEEIDPVKQVESRYLILGKIEEQLSTARTKLASLRSFMGEEAPSVTVLRNEIGALEKQLETERAKLGAKSPESGQQTLGGLVANYEELVVDREFAEKAYVSALSSLERARAEADRQQRYIAAFVRPVLPEEALYPRRILGTLTVLALSTVLWALGVLIAYAIRDHAL